MSSVGKKKLQFVPFSSMVTPGFWYQLVEKKLNEFKLDNSAKMLQGFYSNSNVSAVPSQHCIEFDSFGDEAAPSLCFKTHGNLYNTNTIEEFKEINKKHLLAHESQTLWNDIITGKAISEPSLLVRFFLLSFADLKRYQFYYWFGFPSFLRVTDHFTVKECSPIHKVFSEEKITLLNAKLKSYKGYSGFFLLSHDDTCFESSTCHPLSDFKSLLSSGRSICFVFSDPSTLSDYAGWPLRNLLLLIVKHWISELNGKVHVIGLRYKNVEGARMISNSLWLDLSYDLNHSELSEMPDCVGWEKNKLNKLGPRQVNLAENMDPKKLAESAVDLNLKLMRWRLMPTVNLERISQSRCLLLGAGTLGCNVARALIGWGVKKITFVDYGRVSFSNPVRQTLFEFSDCSCSGGRPKAIAAAERLEKIYPGVETSGIKLSIPMPGHPVDTNAKTLESAKADVAALTDLIEDHDVIFLLMDTRESRWLPTLIGSSKRKLIINAALGFDSYLVMRHGITKSSPQEVEGAGVCQPKLGCYFCNDVVAPGNSVRDRTLDQQCTVSRPGVSMIAAAIAAELFVSVIQHKDGAEYIPPDHDEDLHEERAEHPLGKIPHQIRGFLSHYQTLLPTTSAFSKCTACSESILNRYELGQTEFLLEVFNSPPKYLEDITGLTLLHEETALAEDEILELSDCESL